MFEGCFNIFFYGFILLCFLYVFDIVGGVAIAVWLFTPGILFWIAVLFIVWVLKSLFKD